MRKSYFSASFFTLCFSLLFVLSSATAQDDGKTLFKSYCSACHTVTDQKGIGPGLKGIKDKHDGEWLIKWIQNSQSLVKAGDPEAVAIFEEYNKIPMPNQDLTVPQIKELLKYIENPEGASASTASNSLSEGGSDNAAFNKKGQALFKSYCSACHNVTDQKSIGPGLKDVDQRHDGEWLIKWIQNSQSLVKAGDPEAVAIFEEYNKIPMPNQALTDEQIKDVLAYIKQPVDASTELADKQSDVSVTNKQGEGFGLKGFVWFLIIGSLLAVVLIFMLNSLRVKREVSLAQSQGKVYDGPVSVLEVIKATLSKNRGLVVVGSIILTFALLLWILKGSLGIGVHQGYKPVQPIKFSHQVHAGDNKIDCNYCHSGARHSKTSGVPSLNVCVNCHLKIDGSHGKEFEYDGETYSMTEEIKKVREAAGMDFEKMTFTKEKTPIKWVKVHNLPDHVYFNHSQHVTVGKIQCQKCHGEVEKMDVVHQEAPLTMRWCVECHQTSNINASNNGYYEDLFKHMSEKFKASITHDDRVSVKELGGWECAKCHY